MPLKNICQQQLFHTLSIMARLGSLLADYLSSQTKDNARPVIVITNHCSLSLFWLHKYVPAKLRNVFTAGYILLVYDSSMHGCY